MNTMFFLQSGHVSTLPKSLTKVLRWTLEDRSGEDRLPICSQILIRGCFVWASIWLGYLIDFRGNPLEFGRDHRLSSHGARQQLQIVRFAYNLPRFGKLGHSFVRDLIGFQNSAYAAVHNLRKLTLGMFKHKSIVVLVLSLELQLQELRLQPAMIEDSLW